MKITIQRADSLAQVGQQAWEQLDDGGNPFLHYEFLQGLERFGCLDGHGWTPCHLLARSGENLLGALPLYVRDNSYGEFVFDWPWADAYEKAGGRYYPKLVTAVPFTPVRGPRLLVRRELGTAREVKALLVKAAIGLVEEARLSSFHCLFTEQDDQKVLEKHGLLPRHTCQFLWRNRNYRDFDDFLQGLTSRRRKEIRRERTRVRDSGVQVLRLLGADITPAHWAAFYEFYCATFHKRWGSPRLTLDFFMHLGEKLPDRTLLVLARQAGNYAAGAFAMLDDASLYGRHWGCNQYFANLHFELCYYQTIEYCLERRLRWVDAGVQGEHKINRGFEPVLAVSGHWLRHQGFRDAVAGFLRQETMEMNAYVEHLQAHSPYKGRR